jgi:hypothetical protein
MESQGRVLTLEPASCPMLTCKKSLQGAEVRPRSTATQAGLLGAQAIPVRAVSSFSRRWLIIEAADSCSAPRPAHLPAGMQSR